MPGRKRPSRPRSFLKETLPELSSSSRLSAGPDRPAVERALVEDETHPPDVRSIPGRFAQRRGVRVLRVQPRAAECSIVESESLREAAEVAEQSRPGVLAGPRPLSFSATLSDPRPVQTPSLPRPRRGLPFTYRHHFRERRKTCLLVCRVYYIYY
jgi:hypothetical protein